MGERWPAGSSVTDSKLSSFHAMHSVTLNYNTRKQNPEMNAVFNVIK